LGCRTAALAGLEIVNGCELVGCEFDVEDVEVLRDPLGPGQCPAGLASAPEGSYRLV
jgi:hypothetical protein